MIATAETVKEWLDDVARSKVTRIELHSKIDSKIITTLQLGTGANDGEDLGSVAERLFKRAVREGAAIPVVRATFFLFAYKGEGPNYVDSTSIVVDGANAKGKSGEHVEEYESSVTGLLTQLMRTNLDQTRLILSSQESRHVHAEQLIDRLQKDNERYQSERIEVWKLLETVQTMHLEREQIRNAMVLEGKRDDFIFDKMNMLVPVVLNRLMGGGPGKGTPYFGEEMLRVLLGSFTPQQTDAMLKNQPLQLSEAQLGLIAELTLAYAEKEKQRQRRHINVEANKVADADANGVSSKESPS